MKLHDLKPAPGSRKERTRVGRGIAAGKGKTAGRGTKGQKSRSGASIPAWFEGGQTPLHMRIPKLRGFKRRGRIEFQVVNIGRISEYAASGRFGVEAEAEAAGPGRGKRAPDPLTVNVEMLRSAGLVGSERQPVKILGNGDVTQKLFVAAEAFTRSAREKIEGAGGFVQVLAPQRSVIDEVEDAPVEEPASPVREPAPDGEPATAIHEPATTADEPTTTAAAPAMMADEPTTIADQPTAGARVKRSRTKAAVSTADADATPSATDEGSAAPEATAEAAEPRQAKSTRSRRKVATSDDKVDG